MKQKQILSLYSLFCIDCEDIRDRIADYIYDLEVKYNSSFLSVIYSLNDADADIKDFIKQAKFFIEHLKDKDKINFVKSILSDVQYQYELFKVHKKKVEKTYNFK